MIGEDIESVNSELRYITMELMKIAAQRKMTFEDVAREFLGNATLLQKMIESSEGELPHRFIHPNTPPPHRTSGSLRIPRPPNVKPGTQ